MSLLIIIIIIIWIPIKLHTHTHTHVVKDRTDNESSFIGNEELYH